jgi:hypothetical protein
MPTNEPPRKLAGGYEFPIPVFLGRLNFAAFVPFIPTGDKDPIRLRCDRLLP